MKKKRNPYILFDLCNASSVSFTFKLPKCMYITKINCTTKPKIR